MPGTSEGISFLAGTKAAEAFEASTALEIDGLFENTAGEVELAVEVSVGVELCAAFEDGAEICARSVDTSVLLPADCAVSLVESDFGFVSLPVLGVVAVVEFAGVFAPEACCAFAARIKAWAMSVGRSGVPAVGVAALVGVVPELEASSDSGVVAGAGLEVVDAIGASRLLEANTAARTNIDDRSDALENSVDLPFADVGEFAVGVVTAAVFEEKGSGGVAEASVKGSGVSVSSTVVVAGTETG